jgi:hypothetical protein
MKRQPTFALSLLALAIALIASPSTGWAQGKKALIILQENTGTLSSLEQINLPANVKTAIKATIDALAENFEDMKASLQASGRYDRVHLLTDVKCTRADLLNRLVQERKDGNVVDMVVLGHGLSNFLQLHGSERLTGGSGGNIRSLLADARSRGAADLNNLRMVYMCNCFGSTVNDDWRAIGARASVGAADTNFMPEPTTTFFMNDWLSGKTVGQTAQGAFDGAKMFFLAIFPPVVVPKYKTVTEQYWCGDFPMPWTKTCTRTRRVFDGYTVQDNPRVQRSRLIVSGNANITFSNMAF